jgi:invasion protein IalB
MKEYEVRGTIKGGYARTIRVFANSENQARKIAMDTHGFISAYAKLLQGA